MRSIFIGLFILLFAGLGFYYWSNGNMGKEVGRFTDASIPLYFEYPDGEEGYVLIDQPSNESEPNLIKRLVLMNKAEYQSLLDDINNGRDGREGPPAITVQVFSNPSNLSVMEWVEQNPGASHFPLLMGEFGEVNIAGTTGVTYEADGLYASRNTVFAARNQIYMISGGFLNRESAIYRDYETVRNSITLE
jgi:hypothetical protein